MVLVRGLPKLDTQRANLPKQPYMRELMHLRAVKHDGGGIVPVRWMTDTECENRYPSRFCTIIMQVSVAGGP